MKRFFWLFSFLLLSSHAVQAKGVSGEPPYIYELYKQFIVSNTVASMCGTFDQKIVTNNQKNFQTVAVRAGGKVKELKPHLSEQEIAARLRKMGTALINRTEKAVRKLGCDHENMQTLIKLYKTQSNWRPN